MAGKIPSRAELEHLRSWRAYRELSMEKLAEIAGITSAAISRLENGLARANPVTVFKLARALGISRRQLLEEEPPEEELKDHEWTKEGEKEGRAVA